MPLPSLYLSFPAFSAPYATEKFPWRRGSSLSGLRVGPLGSLRRAVGNPGSLTNGPTFGNLIGYTNCFLVREFLAPRVKKKKNSLWTSIETKITCIFWAPVISHLKKNEKFIFQSLKIRKKKSYTSIFFRMWLAQKTLIEKLTCVHFSFHSRKFFYEAKKICS